MHLLELWQPKTTQIQFMDIDGGDLILKGGVQLGFQHLGA